MIADRGEVLIFSRNGADITRTFPELTSVSQVVGARSVVLDGEIVALDTQGRPSFTRLQRRWPQQRRPGPTLLREVPVRLMAFDVISADGRDLTGEPYVKRREALESLVSDEPGVLTVPKAFFGVPAADMLEVAREHQMEGIVSKRVDSPYREGRSPWWVKSPVRQTAELALVAFAGPPGRVGALLVAGYRDDGALELVGQVGTGFSAVMRRQLFEALHPLVCEVPPVVNPGEQQGWRWVRPHHVGEVAFREWAPGRGLRHASWKGLRSVHVSETRLPTAL